MSESSKKWIIWEIIVIVSFSLEINTVPRIVSVLTVKIIAIRPSRARGGELLALRERSRCHCRRRNECWSGPLWRPLEWLKCGLIQETERVNSTKKKSGLLGNGQTSLCSFSPAGPGASPDWASDSNQRHFCATLHGGCRVHRVSFDTCCFSISQRFSFFSPSETIRNFTSYVRESIHKVSSYISRC